MRLKLQKKEALKKCFIGSVFKKYRGEIMKKELIVVGDRVLIEPDEGQDRTETGLYLPQGVKEKEKVQSGTVIKIGPGYPIPDPADLEIEPWQSPKLENKYFPLQAKEGDYCIFLRNAGVEIEF
jgi:co-chaperonin GroES (HSP10)